MMGFGRRRTLPLGEAETYAKALASWQIENEADYRDLTADQSRRMRLHNLGLDATRLQWWRYLAERGLVTS